MSEEMAQRLHDAIQTALPEADIHVEVGSPGHYSLDVCWSGFEGLKTLDRQRKVYAAITELMAGDAAPVHAIDRMQTRSS